MTFEQLPLDEQLKLKQAFLNNKEIKELDQIAFTFQKQRQFIKALEIRKEIDRRWEYLKQSHLKDYDKVVEETVKLSDLNLPNDILQPLLENIISIFMCCSIIETCHFDANEIIKKANPNYSVDNFSDLVSLIDNVKRKLKYLQDTTGYMDDMYWYDTCDKFQTMVKNKALSILKKKDSNWKNNLKKYVDGTL